MYIVKRHITLLYKFVISIWGKNIYIVKDVYNIVIQLCHTYMG